MRFLGCLVFVAGMALAAWTVAVLGWRRLLWLGEAEGHEEPALVFGGPYRKIRHPFFLSVILMLTGAVLVSGGVVQLVALAAAVVVLPSLAKQEEKILVARFGEPYRRYQQNVPLMFPRIGGKRSPR
jgi:protein-S-isoprenylcysteine O-methyltransferase Ste14